jgi:Tfp pilus assembly protein PilN
MSDNAQQSSEPLSGRKDTSAAQHRPRYWLYLLVTVVVIAALFFLGWLPRHSINKKVQA